METIYIGSDNLIEVRRLRNLATKAAVNDAVLSWRLLDAEETELATGSLVYVDDSDATYQGTIDAVATAGLEADERYFVEVTAVADEASVLFRVEHVAGYYAGC